MRRFTRPLAFAAGAALAVGALVLPSVPEPADAQTSTTIVKQQGFGTPGLITLDLNRASQVQFQTATATTSQAALPKAACGVTIGNGTTDILSVRAIGGTGATQVRVGYDGARIGVGQSQDAGSACYEANLSAGGQKIELTFGGRLVRDMNLDLQFKGEAGLQATGSLRGTNVPITVVGGPGDASDDGPDCAGCDHYRVSLTPAGPIDRLELSPRLNAAGTTNPSTASVALSGGIVTDTANFTRGDLTYNDRGSVFQVVPLPDDGTLGCDGSTITDGDTQVQITHLPAGTVSTGAGANNTCTVGAPYAIIRDLNGNSLDTVLIALPNLPTDAFVVKVPFTDPQNLAKASNGDYYLSTPTKVDYLITENGVLLPETDPRRVQALTLCDGTYPATSGSVYSQLSMSVDVLPDAGKQGVCGIERTITLRSGATTTTGADSVTVTETVLIVGDPRLLGN